jgi:hypothetical protein
MTASAGAILRTPTRFDGARRYAVKGGAGRSGFGSTRAAGQVKRQVSPNGA